MCTSSFVDDVMFSRVPPDGPITNTGHWRVIHGKLPGGAGAKSAVELPCSLTVAFSCLTTDRRPSGGMVDLLLLTPVMIGMSAAHKILTVRIRHC